MPRYVTNNLYFQILINNPNPFTSCLVEVHSENTCNDVTYPGPIMNVCARTSDIVPDPVQRLSAIAVSDHSFFVTWEPPLNYVRPGLSYSVDITENTATFALHTSTVLDQTYLFMNMNLTPNTNYNVKVKAVSSVGMSIDAIVNIMTKPSLPSPPDNIRFSMIETTGVTLEWNAQSSVANYTIFWKCNEMDGNITTTGTTILINNSVNLGIYTWCTARVQSANEVGLSDLSAAVSTVISQSVPSRPICFLVDNQGSSVIFSFTVTDPFSLDELNVNWQLNTSSTTTVLNDRHRFENSSLTIQVERNTAYIFSLRLCNLHGCGDYCSSITFTTNTVSFLVSLCFNY